MLKNNVSFIFAYLFRVAQLLNPLEIIKFTRGLTAFSSFSSFLMLCFLCRNGFFPAIPKSWTALCHLFFIHSRMTLGSKDGLGSGHVCVQELTTLIPKLARSLLLERTSFLKQCLSNLNVYAHLLGIFLKCRL